MIQVIKHGNRIKTTKCSHCACEFSYNIVKDVANDKYVVCPECGNHVNIDMKHFSDENHDSMKDYGHSIMHHEDDHHLDDYEDSLLVRHWLDDLKLKYEI